MMQMTIITVEWGVPREQATQYDPNRVEQWEAEHERSSRDFAAGENGECSEHEAEQHRAGITEQNFRRRKIKNREGERPARENRGERDDCRLIEVMVTRPRREEEDDECSQSGDARRKSRDAVEPIERIGEQHDPRDREKISE